MIVSHQAHAFEFLNPRIREGLVVGSRRNFLKAGLAGVGGLTLPGLLRQQAAHAGALAARHALLERLLRAKAVLLPGVTVTLHVEKGGAWQARTWSYPGGLQDCKYGTGNPGFHPHFGNAKTNPLHQSGRRRSLLACRHSRCPTTMPR